MRIVKNLSQVIIKIIKLDKKLKADVFKPGDYVDITGTYQLVKDFRVA